MPKIRPMCTFPNCGRPNRAKGYCATHYSHLVKHGDFANYKPRETKGPAIPMCKEADCKKEEYRKKKCYNHYVVAVKTGKVSIGRPEQWDEVIYEDYWQFVKKELNLA